MMISNRSRLFRLGLGIVLCMLTFVQSCKKADDQVNIDQPQQPKASLKDISYQDFLKNVKPEKLGFLKSTMTSGGSGKVMYLAQNDVDLKSLGVILDSLRILETGNEKSYVFRMEQTSPRAVSFRNFTISFKNDKAYAFITTYTPTAKWIAKKKFNDFLGFDGTITNTPVKLEAGTFLEGISLTTSEANPSGKVATIRSKVAVAQVCVTTFVFLSVPIGCSRDNHMPWQDCVWLIPGNANDLSEGEYPPHWITETFNVTECYPLPDNSTGNGGGGGGGSTTPNPPPGYNPCSGGGGPQPTPGGSEASGRNGLVNRLMVHENPECNPSSPQPGGPSNTDPVEAQINTTEPSYASTVYNPETNATYSYQDIKDYYNSHPEIYESFITDDFSTPTLTLLIAKYGYEKALMIMEEAYVLSNYYNVAPALVLPLATWNVLNGEGHFILDLVGMLPVVGEPADIINGAIYFVEGDNLNAVLSASSAIPVVGWVSTAGKWGKKAVKVMSKTSKPANLVGYVALKTANGKAVRFVKYAEQAFSHTAVKALKAIRPADNTLTNLSRHLVDQFSFRVKPVAQGLKNKIDDIVLHGDATGVKTESICDDIFEVDGFVKHEAKIGSNNGFDGVYIKRDANNQVTDIIINESKQIGARGNIQLNAAGAKAAQMSDQWINQTILQMENSSSVSIAQLGSLLNANRTIIRKTATAVDKSRGEIVILKLSNY